MAPVDRGVLIGNGHFCQPRASSHVDDQHCFLDRAERYEPDSVGIRCDFGLRHMQPEARLGDATGSDEHE